jgi:hypothetical protein
MIMIWSGSVGSIPTGWTLCNGSNSTPDLRDKFVIGAGSTYAVNGTGGSKDAVVVSHTHTATTTVTDPGHLHNYGNTGTGIGNAGGGNASVVNAAKTVPTTTSTTGITVATTNSTEGVSGTNANLPPYYALCYIMKT